MLPPCISLHLGSASLLGLLRWNLVSDYIMRVKLMKNVYERAGYI